MMQKFRIYVELAKPRILTMILVTATLGFFMAGRGIYSYSQLCIFLLGTALSCAGAGMLNNYIERDADSLMKRTKQRPIPRGSVGAQDVMFCGIALVLAGTALLIWRVNLLCGFLALLTAFLYVIVYTPLKKVTWLNTFVGAIPGALP